MKNGIKLILFMILMLSNIELISYDKIIKINVNYTDFLACPQTYLDEKYFLNKKYLKLNIVESETIRNDSILKQIQNIIDKKLKPVKIKKCKDIRLVLQIFRKSGKIDILSFGECFVLNYNKKVYKQDLQLLNLIIPFISKEERYNYKHYREELEKYFYGK